MGSFNKNILEWTKDEEEAFNETRGLLCDSTLLTFPAEDGIPASCTGASEVGVGTALEQLAKDRRESLGFFSTFDRELLAAHFAAQHSGVYVRKSHCNCNISKGPIIIDGSN